CHGDLPSDFPPLRSLDAFEYNLPTLLTRLIGREGDTAAVVAAMRDGRLGTLVGAGGVGETRLGFEVAGEVGGEFAGGVWWGELGRVSDGSSVAGAVLDAVGHVAQPGRRPVQVVSDYVGERPTLLVLDNCEQVIAASASFVAEVLSRVPGVSVLATSREPL